ncbi:MAG: GNAT family N-acetyltransferase [Rhizobiaceae bacterium]|nr:GNAT family N-acetyltransferase [Rhizobiaceae bacterium]
MWVRTASRRDIAAISKLLGEVWHSTYDGIYGPERVTEITSKWHNVNALEKQLTRPASEFLVADDGEVIAGMAFGSQIDDKHAKLHQLYVLGQYQGRGVGKMLLDEIEESFFEAKEIVLEVEEQNVGAVSFYKKNGFKQTGKTSNCGEKDSGIAALVFSKNH